MKKNVFVFFISILCSWDGFSQIVSHCDNVSAFNKNSNPDLGIVIYSNDPETVWNALRLANYSQSQGDTVVLFVIGKGVDIYLNDTSMFKINTLSQQFVANGGNIYTCATCAKLRGSEEVKSCTVTSLADLYIIIKKSKKTISF